jgi:hypothetical protein
MELKSVTCETCGGFLEFSADKTTAKCSICGNSFFIQNSPNATLSDGLMKKLIMQIEDGLFDEAEKLCDKIAETDSENADLWLCRLMAETRTQNLDELAVYKNDYIKSTSFLRFLNFADEAQKQRYNKSLEKLHHSMTSEAPLREQEKKAEQQEAEKCEREQKNLKEERQNKIEELKKFVHNTVVNNEIYRNWLALPDDIDEGLNEIREKQAELYTLNESEYLLVDKTFYNLCLLSVLYHLVNDRLKDYEGNGQVLKKYNGDKTAAEMKIPFGISIIGERVFCNYYRFKNIVIPDSVKRIGKETFSGNKDLTRITLPDGLKYIDEFAFRVCIGITPAIVIPASVTRIGLDAFMRCDGLTAILVNKNNNHYTDIDGVLFNKDATTILYYPPKRTGSRYVIPNGVTEIAKGAFAYCKNLKTVTIPETVTSISTDSFVGCEKLKVVLIPDGVDKVAHYAFNDCKNLSTVYVNRDKSKNWSSEWLKKPQTKIVHRD